MRAGRSPLRTALQRRQPPQRSGQVRDCRVEERQRIAEACRLDTTVDQELQGRSERLGLKAMLTLVQRSVGPLQETCRVTGIKAHFREIEHAPRCVEWRIGVGL